MPAIARSRPGPPVAGIPFTASAHEHVEPITTQTYTPAAANSPIQQGPFDVPAYGYLRHIWLEVTATGGTIGAGVLNADYPWDLFQNVTLLDVNGAPLVNIDGFSLLQCNIYGAPEFRSDPRLSPAYVGTINANFFLRIPIEISRHNGLGALPNQNAAAAYKLQWTLNNDAVLYTTAPTTRPAFTIKAALEAWSLPNPVDLAGRSQAQVPPAVGTSQYISFFSRTTTTGNLTYLLPRVGNLIRYVLFIARNSSANTPRDDTVFPDPFQITWDARTLTNETQKYRINKQASSLVPSSTRDTGVFALLFNNSIQGNVGDEDPSLWIPTVQSSRLELDGTTATAGTIQTITSDIAPVEVLPQERYVETSASGFHPRIGEPNQAAM